MIQSIDDIIQKLFEFWSKNSQAISIPSLDFPVGAGTFHPSCFFGSLSNQPESYMFVQPCMRKADGRYGESPNRLLRHHQFQLFLKPNLSNIKELVLDSLDAIGLDQTNNYIRFNDNNWESISLGAIGVGWDITCNMMEIAQFTYFQKIGDIALHQLFPVEIAYGIERLATNIFNQNIFDIKWSKNILYKDLFLDYEKQMSEYYIQRQLISLTLFDDVYQSALQIITNRLYLPAYYLLLELNDIFNSLDAKCLIGAFERKNYIDKMRKIANLCAKLFIEEHTLQKAL